LQVIARFRRHGTKGQGRKIADVDAHLQRRCAGEQVGVAGLCVEEETLLHAFPLLPLQQTGVFGGEDTFHIARAIERPVIVIRGRLRAEAPLQPYLWQGAPSIREAISGPAETE
jgi:hypothetical protein